MSRRQLRNLIILASISLIGLFVIQVFWFKKAFDVQEKQFNDQIKIALRSTAHLLLKKSGDSTTIIEPIEKKATNSYLVQLKKDFSYNDLAEFINKEFKNRNINQEYEVAVIGNNTDEMIYGYYFSNDEGKSEIPCLTRDHITGSYNFTVTFPHQKVHILGQMQIWIFTSIIFLIVLIYFAYSFFIMMKEKKMSEIRKDFINTMTHELKTPISNIAVASEVLKDADNKLTDRKSIQYANIIYKENQRLKKQIDKVLEMALLENGRIDLKVEEFDINKLIEEIVEDYALIIQVRGGKLVFIQKAQKSIVMADKLQLSNVIYNLLDNADKYSPSSPEISLSAVNFPDGLIVSVSDKGVGINKEYQKLIFEKFYRVPSGDVHDVKGLGLGLSYVKMIIEAHGGNLKVESIINQGSTFSFSI